jgi:photosystem II stability/assembly factor-like uncharacterized protein
VHCCSQLTIQISTGCDDGEEMTTKRRMLILTLLSVRAYVQGQIGPPLSRIAPVGSFNHGSPEFFTPLAGWNLQANRQLVRTTDGGMTWVPVGIPNEPDQAIQSVFFQSASEAWVSVAPPDPGGQGKLFRTLDGGRAWSQQMSPSEDWYMHSLFSRGESVWLGGQRAISARTQPGSTECNQKLLSFGKIWISVVYHRGEVGSGWVEQHLPVETGCPVAFLRFLDNSRGIAVAGTRVFYTQDSGSRWVESQVVTLSGKQSWHARTLPFGNLFFLEGSDQIAWLSNPGGDLLKTNDGGRHWRQVLERNHSWPEGLGFGAWGALYFVTENRGWTLGGDGEVFETRDGGARWISLKAPVRISGLTGAQGMCWVSGEGQLYRIEWQ